MTRQLSLDLSASLAPKASKEEALPTHSASRARAAEALSARLSAIAQRPIHVTLTKNRRVMISAKRHGAGKNALMELRLHAMFQEADDAMQIAIVEYITKQTKRSAQQIDAFIDAHRALLRTDRPAIRCHTRGLFHDLSALMESLRPHFQERLDDVKITWGRKRKRLRRQRAIQLGTYTPADQLIRIHPVLDQEWVPSWYVRCVIFHELLHHVLGGEETSAGMRFHTPEFRALERAFEDHERSQAWEKKHLTKLLRSL